MSKRKPPSKRPERKLDDLAKAIARVREDAKPEKASEPGRISSEAQSRSGPLGKGTSLARAGGQAMAASTRRQKKV